MKTARHQRILEIITQNAVQTQEDLLEFLKQEGYVVTQATVSRDIKELNLVKLRNAQGVYCYTRHQLKNDSPDGDKYLQILRSSVKSVDLAMNLVVIKCAIGMAGAACASIDALSWDGNVVGTLAGDDTILLVARSEKNAKLLYGDLRELLN